MFLKILVLALLVANAAASGGYSSFAYGVSDPNTGDVKDQNEKRIGNKVVGQYSLLEPDGTKRIVEYSADPYTGFKAVVRKDPPNGYAETYPQNGYAESYPENGYAATYPSGYAQAYPSYANSYPSVSSPHHSVISPDQTAGGWNNAASSGNSYLNGWSEPGHPTSYTDNWSVPMETAYNGWDQGNTGYVGGQAYGGQTGWSVPAQNGWNHASAQPGWQSPHQNGWQVPSNNGWSPADTTRTLSRGPASSYVNALTPSRPGYSAGHAGQNLGVYGRGPMSYQYTINHGSNYASQYKW